MRTKNILLLFALLAITVFTVTAVRSFPSDAELEQAAKKAVRNGVDSTFLAGIVASEQASFVQKTVRINVTNYAYTPDYSGHYNSQAVKSVKAFMQEHDSLLSAVEQKHNVDKAVVASILWIESRCGKITGKYHVPSVYLSLVLADEPEYVQQSYDKVVSDNSFTAHQKDSVKKLIEKRAQKKSQWAVKELKALEEINAKGTMNVHALNGSWAGAFGFPQFLPSSYNRLAIDGNNDGLIDLYSFEDASHSIANYLSKNGWGATTSKKRKAVHSYNNSDAYVDAVFILAEKVS